MNIFLMFFCFFNLGFLFVWGWVMKCVVMWVENKNIFVDWNDGFKILNYVDLFLVYLIGILINVIWGKCFVRLFIKLGIIEEMWIVFIILCEYVDVMFWN